MKTHIFRKLPDYKQGNRFAKLGCVFVDRHSGLRSKDINGNTATYYQPEPRPIHSKLRAGEVLEESIVLENNRVVKCLTSTQIFFPNLPGKVKEVGKIGDVLGRDKVDVKNKAR